MSQWRAGAGGAASLASVYRLWCRSEQRPGRCGGAGRGGALRTVAAVSRATPGVRPAPPHVLLVPEVTLRPPPPPLHAWRMEDIVQSTENMSGTVAQGAQFILIILVLLPTGQDGMSVT